MQCPVSEHVPGAGHSHPFAICLSQSRKPALHVAIWQTPLTHAAVTALDFAWIAVVQLLPQANWGNIPQLSGLVLMSVSHPALMSPAQ
jgi:hypothetical protein